MKAVIVNYAGEHVNFYEMVEVPDGTSQPKTSEEYNDLPIRVTGSNESVRVLMTPSGTACLTTSVRKVIDNLRELTAGMLIQRC